MKNFRVKILILLIISIWAVNPVFSETFENFQKGFDGFSEKAKKSLPFNSTMGLNWSDSYIGQITDIPPRFGVGISAGFTSMDIDDLSGGLFASLKNNVIGDIGLPIPGYTVEGRIGGIILPFDIGVKFGYLPPNIVKNFTDFDLKHLLLGFDVRYSLLNRKILIPKLSIGLGFNFMDGGITTYHSSPSSSIDFSGDQTLAPSQIDLLWRTMSVEFKAQASFPFKFITPYAGAGVSYAWSRTGYKVKTDSEHPINDDIKTILKEEDQQIKVTSDTGFEKINKFSGGISARAFGGVSLNIAFFRIDITGMYDFIGGNLGGTLGMRFQL